MLIDIGAVPCECANHGLEAMHKAMADAPDDGVWRPHESPLIRWLIEKATEHGLHQFKALYEQLSQWLAHASGRRLPGGITQWSTKEAEVVRLYLAALPAEQWGPDEYNLLVDSLFQEYLPAQWAKTEADWLTKRAALAGKIQAAAHAMTDLEAAMLLKTWEQQHAIAAALERANLNRAILEYGAAATAQNIVTLTDSMRNAIKAEIITHQHETILGQPPQQALTQRLFDRFGTWNRDWRRIALTEAGEMTNQGHIASLAPGTRVKRMEQYKGVCAFCAKWNNRILTVVSADAENKDGDTQVWPGKTNLGRSSSPYKVTPTGMVKRTKDELWWPAAGTFHPHCRGRWVRVVEPLPGQHDDFDVYLNNFLLKQRKAWAAEKAEATQ